MFLALPARAAHPCAACHPAQTQAYLRTPMGTSLTLHPTGEAERFEHSASRTRYSVRMRGGRMFQTIQRGPFHAEYPIEFAIGSGGHGQGYVVNVAGYLFQSPIAAYRHFTAWDVAPGYEPITAPDFNRRITPECLGCHSSAGDGPTARQPLTCDRCHGDVARHLARASRDTIVNPARLSAAARDSICEQCHLNGEGRVLNPAAALTDFRPGEPTETVFSTFVYDRQKAGLKVVSHAEQLALSACQRATGKLWCGTCHQPHGDPIDIAAQCKSCHPSLSASHPAASEACTVCHMPKRKARDGGHSAFTDHRIQRRPTRESEGSKPEGIRPWRPAPDPALAQRNLGIAYMMIGDRDANPDFVSHGFKLLADIFPRFPHDPDLLSSLGMGLYLKDRQTDGIKFLRAAIAARPADAQLHQKLAAILRAAGEMKEAIRELETAIDLDPALEPVYHMLADLQPTPVERREVLERYLKFNPNSILAREAIARAAHPSRP